MRELDFDRRLGAGDLVPQLRRDVIERALANPLEPDEEVARVRLRDGQGEPGAGAARVALDLGRLAEDLLDVPEHAIGLLERRSRRHDVVEHERPFVHLRKEPAAEPEVEQDAQAQNRSGSRQDEPRVAERPLQHSFVPAREPAQEPPFARSFSLRELGLCRLRRRAQEPPRQDGREEDRQEQGCEQRGHHRQSQSAEEDGRDAAEEHERNEDDDRRQGRSDQRRRQLLDGALRRLGRALPHRDVDRDVLHHHDGVVDHHADRGRESPERHQVEAHVEELHEDDCDQGGDRDHHGRHERRTPVLQEPDQHRDRQHEADDDALGHSRDRVAHQDRLVVEDRELDVGRERGADVAQLAVDGRRDLDGAAVGLLQHVDEHSRPAVGRHDVVDGSLARDDPGEVPHHDGRSLHDGDDRVLDLFLVTQQPGDGRQVEMVVLLDHSRRGDQVAVADRVYHLGERHPVPVQLLGLDQNVVLGLAAAHDARLGDSGEAVEPGGQVVVGEIPQVGGRARRRRDAEADHGKDGEGQAVDVEAGRRGERRRDLGDPALHEVQRVEDVDVPAEENADLGGAACGDRAYRRDPRHQTDRLLDRARYAQHLDVDGSDAVVDQYDDAREIGLRKDRDRELEDAEDSGQREGEDDQDEGAAVGLDERSQPARHFGASTKRTSVPSGRP